MEAVVEKVYDIKISITETELNKIFESLGIFYFISVLKNNVSNHSALWDLDNQLLLAKKNAEL